MGEQRFAVVGEPVDDGVERVKVVVIRPEFFLSHLEGKL